MTSTMTTQALRRWRAQLLAKARRTLDEEAALAAIEAELRARGASL